jgi:ankyrin repeat protein
MTSRTWNSAIQAIVRDDTSALARLLVDGVYADEQRNGVSLLHVAASHDSFGCIEILLNKGVDPNIADDMGFKPLFYICTHAPSRRASLCGSLLIRYGADSHTLCINVDRSLETICKTFGNERLLADLSSTRSVT